MKVFFLLSDNLYKYFNNDFNSQVKKSQLIIRRKSKFDSKNYVFIDKRLEIKNFVLKFIHMTFCSLFIF
jgi:hypothetical protein